VIVPAVACVVTIGVAVWSFRANLLAAREFNAVTVAAAEKRAQEDHARAERRAGEDREHGARLEAERREHAEKLAAERREHEARMAEGERAFVARAEAERREFAQQLAAERRAEAQYKEAMAYRWCMFCDRRVHAWFAPDTNVPGKHVCWKCSAESRKLVPLPYPNDGETEDDYHGRVLAERARAIGAPDGPASDGV
jgi:hypothetical protein